MEIIYDLHDAVQLLESGQNRKLLEARKLKTSVLNHFLYSGRFNSVLGLEGFNIFREKLKDVFSRVNNKDFGANIINLDKMFEALLDSGVYYVEEYLPDELSFLKSDNRWLTAYRYIAKNFPYVAYKDFREIVKRFQSSRGHSIFVDPSDSDFFQNMAKNSHLFEVTVDLKAALLQLNQKELKGICEVGDVQPARSLSETADRILNALGERVSDHLPAKIHGRLSLAIKDQELATGDDIIGLDTYLRAISKVVREDLVNFVTSRQYSQWSR